MSCYYGRYRTRLNWPMICLQIRYLLLKRAIFNQIWVCKSKIGGAYLCIPFIPGFGIDDVGGGGILHTCIPERVFVTEKGQFQSNLGM